jgi:hypothetical protein
MLTDQQAGGLMDGAVRRRDVPGKGDCSWLAPKVPAMLTVYKPVAVAASPAAGRDQMAIRRTEVLGYLQSVENSSTGRSWSWPYDGFPDVRVSVAGTTALAELPGVGDEAVAYTARGAVPYDEVTITLLKGNVVLTLQWSGRRDGTAAAADRARRSAAAVAETLTRLASGQ